MTPYAPAAQPIPAVRTRSPAVLVGLLVLAATLAFVFKAANKMPDFEVYWKVGARAAAAEPLYRADDGHWQFKYLPAFAMLAAPAALLPLPVAKAVWFGTSVALIVALIAWSIRLLPEQRKSTSVLAAAAVVAMGKFLAHELVLGQVNLLLGVVVIAALLSLRRGREARAGALFALAIVIKPYAVIFLPWIVARRKIAALAAAGAAVGATLLLPAVIYGLDGNLALHQDWWRTVTESTAPNLMTHDNVSLAAMFTRWVGPGALAGRLALTAAVLLVLVAAAVFAGRRGVRFPEALEGALLLTLIPLLSPQGWDYVFLLATPAIVVLANYEDRLPGPLRPLTIAAVLVIGLSLFDLMGRRAYYAFMSMSIVSLCFFVVIAALGVLRRQKIA